MIKKTLFQLFLLTFLLTSISDNLVLISKITLYFFIVSFTILILLLILSEKYKYENIFDFTSFGNSFSFQKFKFKKF